MSTTMNICKGCGERFAVSEEEARIAALAIDEEYADEAPITAEEAANLLAFCPDCAGLTRLTDPDTPRDQDGRALLHYAAFRTGSLVDGPGGPRTVLWLQGCRQHCPGCQNPELWPTDELLHGNLCQPNVMAATIFRESEGQPLTLTGGEPMDQPEALTFFLLTLRSIDATVGLNRNIILYTGRTWSTLREEAYDDPYIMRVLTLVDIVVDGAYIQHLDNDNLQWRGSSNQEVIDTLATFLSGQKVTLDWDSAQEIQIDGAMATMTGGLAETLGVENGQEIARCGQAREE